LHELKHRLAELTAAVDALLERQQAEAGGDPPSPPPA
jgi:hypothetical protein